MASFYLVLRVPKPEPGSPVGLTVQCIQEAEGGQGVLIMAITNDIPKKSSLSLPSWDSLPKLASGRASGWATASSASTASRLST